MTEKRIGVAFYGKVRIPTIGHRKAIDTAKGIAKKVGGQLRIGLSGTSKPLTPEIKKSHAEMMFNHPVETGDEHSRNLFSYLSHLNQHHDEIHLVAGSDRAPEYRRTLQDWNGRADRSGRVGFNFKKWKVHEVEGERGDVDKHPTQMSKDELERSVSATKLEGLAKSGDYEGFKAYHPGFPEKHVRKVYNQIRMGSSEEPAPKTVKQIRSKKVVREEFHDHGELNHEKFGPMLDTFVQFASDKIGIKEMPTMKLQKEIMASSFGGYNPAEKSIVVITKNRHPMDIYRTVAHELVHHKQNEDGRLGKDIRKEGATGSPIENEANAEAGKVMRWFAKANPEMFKSGYVTESYIEEGLQDTGRAKAIFMGGGPGSGKDWIGDRAGLLAKGRKTGLGLTEINSDNALEHLMKMRGLDPMMPKEEDFERNVARGDAKRLTKEKERLALAGRRGVVINGTADDPEKIALIKKQLEDLGYETKMLFVNTSNAVSRQRNLERGIQGGRKVPDGTDKYGRPDGSPDIRGEKWEAAQEAKDKLRKLFGDEHFVHVDNSEDYRVVDDNRKKEIDKAHNQLFKHYQQFVSTPAQTEKSKEWAESEKKRRGISQYRPARATTVSQKKPVTPYVPNASELEQAKRLGVQHIGGGQFGGKEGATHVSRGGQLTAINEDLRKWFREKWVRFDTKGNIKGPCAREPGEGKPKCRPMASAVAMGKEARAKAARRKRREDPVANRKGKGGKPVFVKTNEEVLMEKNVPTNPSLWARAKSLARQKFDVYPSAYANGWASKWYKSKGGGWRSKVDENFEKMVSENTPSDREWGKSSLTQIYADATPGQTFPLNPLFEKKKLKKKKLAQEDNTIPRGGIGQSGIGPETTVYRPMVASGFGGAGTIPMYESVMKWSNDPKTQERFVAKYGDLAEQKLNETVVRLNQLNVSSSGPKFFTHLREAWEAKGGRDMGTVLNSSSKQEVAEQSFGKAFSAARAAGEAEFTWNGGRYKSLKKGETELPKPKTVAQPKKDETEPMTRGPRTPEMVTKPDERNVPAKPSEVDKSVNADLRRSAEGRRVASQQKKDIETLEKERSQGVVATSGSRHGKIEADPNEFGKLPDMPPATKVPRAPKFMDLTSDERKEVNDLGSAASDENAYRGRTAEWQKGWDDTRKKWNDMQTKARQSGTPDTTNEDWQKVNRRDKTDGLSQKAVNAYRRENPGSKLQTAVTEKNPKGKRAKRRLSFCRRMSGMKKRLTSAETARDPDSRINKALRRWNCEE